MLKKLAQLQASLTIFYTNLKNFHWNLQDIDFIIIHKFTDKLASETNNFIDELAEKLRSLGTIALASFSDVSQNSDFELFPSQIWSSEEVLEKIAKQIEKILKICKEIQQSQDNNEIEYLVYPLIDEIILFYHKELWKVYAQRPNS
ncbi:Dps family protein [Mesomycoplasma flocculare]|uniref:Dps family protein n=1 Tax=Mesomycoplasma flocculare TaxID=2128 RepID=UPI00136F7FD1|nr:DNA starvation/stationary phase protection protein [Mesomycoplasma flocculare]MXR22788.1 DNA starvation/stationary phase protection protein [Mesomycoplasma flocculare]